MLKKKWIENSCVSFAFKYMYKSITHIGLKVNKPRENKNIMGEGEKFNFYVPTMVNNYLSNPNNNPTKQNKRVGSNGWVNLKE